jgi:mRNA-degrading endonuclease toxin of MazEF toxin-antitoxin module
MKYSKRDIVDVAFDLPDGSLKIHPAIIISGQNYFDTEDSFYVVMVSSKPYNEEFSVELLPEELTNPMPKESYAKCHLIQSFNELDVIKRRGKISTKLYGKIKGKVIEALFFSATTFSGKK